MTEHRHVSLFVDAFNKVCGAGYDDRVYQGFSLSFDGSVEEIWMAFSNGSTLVVPTADAPRFGDELGQYLQQPGDHVFLHGSDHAGHDGAVRPEPADRGAQRRGLPAAAGECLGAAGLAAY